LSAGNIGTLRSAAILGLFWDFVEIISAVLAGVLTEKLCRIQVARSAAVMLFSADELKIVPVAERPHMAEGPSPEGTEFTDALQQLSAASATVLENARKNNYSVRPRPDAVEFYRYGTLLRVCRTNGEIEAFGAQNGWRAEGVQKGVDAVAARFTNGHRPVPPKGEGIIVGPPTASAADLTPLSTTAETSSALADSAADTGVDQDRHMQGETVMPIVRATKKRWVTFFIWGGGAVGGLLTIIMNSHADPNRIASALVAGKDGAQGALLGGIIGGVIGAIVDAIRRARMPRASNKLQEVNKRPLDK
jgi:hypothetical protein